MQFDVTIHAMTCGRYLHLPVERIFVYFVLRSTILVLWGDPFAGRHGSIAFVVATPELMGWPSNVAIRSSGQTF